MGNSAIIKTDKDGEPSGTVELEIRIYPVKEPKGNTKAFASISIDGMFGVHGVSIVEGKNGLFVAMPQTKDAQGNYRDIFHPVTSEGRKALNNAVLHEYSIALEQLAVKQESTVSKIREAKEAKTSQPAPDKSAVKEAGKGVKAKAEATL
ncbi:MAG: SpoVG family protein [Defluviitaleaceae bacterium]|nr:SpoVG family protein [Defluviitaleaceae bacterium]